MDKKSIKEITFSFTINISKDKDKRYKSNFKVFLI